MGDSKICLWDLKNTFFAMFVKSDSNIKNHTDSRTLRMKIFSFLLLMLFSSLGVAGGLPFSFNASLVKSDGEMYISYDLKNNSDRDVEVLKWGLPWMWYNIDVKAYAGGKKLQRMVVVADPWLGDLDTKTLIKSKAMLSERSEYLSEMFPELNESLKKDDVLIIWSYDLGRLGDVGHGDGNRSGKFIIPKTGKDHPSKEIRHE